MSLATISGLFYIIGSPEYKRNQRKDQPYGTDGNKYHYSIGTCENITNLPSSIICKSVYNQFPSNINENERNQDISILLTSRFLNPDIANVDPTNYFWINVFKILEYLYTHQDGAGDLSSIPPFTSNADKDLGDMNSSWYVETYEMTSIIVTPCIDDKSKISKVSFRASIDNVSVRFTIHYNPDDYVESMAHDHIEIYKYEDLDNDPLVSEEEMDLQVIPKLKDIMVKHYNRHDQYKIMKNVYDNEGNFIDVIPEQYFIFSYYHKSKELNNVYLSNIIKLYLLDKYDGNTSMLSTLYPTLFEDDTVEIYPLVSNRDTIGNSTTPIDIRMLKSEMSLRKIDINPFLKGDTYQPIEILLLFGQTSDVSGPKFQYPIAAREGKSGSTLRPISDRYINYNISNNSYNKMNDMFEKLQMYIILSISVIQGLIFIEPGETTLKSIPKNIDYTIIWSGEGELQKVSEIDFVYKSVKYKVFRPIT